LTTIEFQGRKVEMVDQNKLTPGEAAEIERVTGLTFQKIRFLSQFCVCECRADLHDAETTACGGDGCRCVEFAADMPSSVSTALMYVSIKRGDHKVTFAQVSDTPFSDFDEAPADGDAPDPTEPPPVAA
jgi:hypothetical protein